MMDQLLGQSDIAALVKEYASTFAKGPNASITTASGLNFLPLEEEARNTYPVFHPVLDMITRVTPRRTRARNRRIVRAMEADHPARNQCPAFGS